MLRPVISARRFSPYRCLGYERLGERWDRSEKEKNRRLSSLDSGSPALFGPRTGPLPQGQVFLVPVRVPPGAVLSVGELARGQVTRHNLALPKWLIGKVCFGCSRSLAGTNSSPVTSRGRGAVLHSIGARDLAPLHEFAAGTLFSGTSDLIPTLGPGRDEQRAGQCVALLFRELCWVERYDLGSSETQRVPLERSRRSGDLG